MAVVGAALLAVLVYSVVLAVRHSTMNGDYSRRAVHRRV